MSSAGNDNRRATDTETEAEKKTNVRFIVAGFALIPFVFVFDVLTQRGASTSLLYILPLLLGLQSKRNNLYFWYPLALTVLTVIGAFFKPSSALGIHTIIFNRALVIVSLWIITVLVRRRNNADALVYKREKEYRALTENSPDVVIQLDKHLRFLYLNPEALRQLGRPKEMYLGRTLREVVNDDRRYDFWERRIGKAISTGKVMEVEYTLSNRERKNNFYGKIAPIPGPEGNIESVLLVSRDITERRRAEEQIRYISFHDKVTGLFNRAFFEEDLKRIDTERDLPISIIMGDVNYLKLSNDVFGHQEGDKLLKTIAFAIRNACRKDDIVARWGGDEFSVILPKMDLSSANEVCCRIKRIAAGSAGTAIRPSIALGAATKERGDQNIYHTIRQAEERMYNNKIAENRENRENVISHLQGRARDKIENVLPHIQRCRRFARCFGAALDLEEEQMKALQLLAEVHDIGMAVIPRMIATCPGRLSKEEWAVMKKQPEAAFNIVKSFPDTSVISAAVLSLREWWDGSGYPRHIKGKDIPFLSRVFSLIDAYDVMTHPRPYARAFSEKEAVEELRRNAGRQFDPELAETFIAIINAKVCPFA